MRVVPEPPGYDAARRRSLVADHVNLPYPHTEPPNLHPDNLRALVDKAMLDVNMQSSPGMPCAAIQPLNSKLFASHTPLIAHAAVERLKRLIEHRGELSPVELVKAGLCDPVRVFVKQEPHTKAKVNSRRFRLICSISVVDQIVERVLCAEQNNEEILLWGSLASCPGMGLTLDVQTDQLWDNVQEAAKHCSITSSDLSSFDWTVQEFELKGDAESRIQLANAEGTLFAIALRNRTMCLCNKVFALSDGRLYAQLRPGVQASGSYTTSSTNSRVRVAAGFYAGSDWVKAMGDDALEEYRAGALEAYKELGKIVKEYTIFNDNEPFEFCSHLFEARSVVKPLNWARSLYRLLHQVDNKASYLAELLALLRHDAVNSATVCDVVVRAGWCSDNDVIKAKSIVHSASYLNVQTRLPAETWNP